MHYNKNHHLLSCLETSTGFVTFLCVHDFSNIFFNLWFIIYVSPWKVIVIFYFFKRVCISSIIRLNFCYWFSLIFIFDVWQSYQEQFSDLSFLFFLFFFLNYFIFMKTWSKSQRIALEHHLMSHVLQYHKFFFSFSLLFGCDNSVFPWHHRIFWCFNKT